jgi:hypothetical protein
MVQIRDLKKQIEALKPFPKTEKKRELLHYIIMYLETKPRKMFLVSEKKRIKTIIESKMKQYDNWQRNICSSEIEPQKRLAFFKKELNIHLLQRQIKTINIILNN